MDPSRLNQQIININVDHKNNNLLEYAKVICLKLILASESHIYKTYEDQNIKTENLESQEINYTISKYLNDIITQIYIFEDLNEYISNIIELTNEDKDSTLEKIVYIIDHFYSEFLIRNKLNTKTCNEYIENFKVIFCDYFSESRINMLEILLNPLEKNES